MNSILLLTLMIVSCLSQAQVSNDYYLSFTQTIGLSTQVTDDFDCSKVTYNALSGLKAAFEQDYQDVDVLLDAVNTFVDKIKYEVSPMCTKQSGDFESFLSGYFGDAKALREVTEDNLDEQHYLIGKSIADASDALVIGEDSEAGKLHGEIIRTLLGLDEQKTQEVQPVAKSESKSKKDSSDSFVIYQEYINQLNILNAVSEDDGIASDKSERNSDKDEASEGYVQSLISKFQQIKKGNSAGRKLQEDNKHFEASSYNMDL